MIRHLTTMVEDLLNAYLVLLNLMFNLVPLQMVLVCLVKPPVQAMLVLQLVDLLVLYLF